MINMITPRTPFPEAQRPSYSGLHLAMPHGVIKLFKKNLSSLTPTFPFPLEFPLQIHQKTKAIKGKCNLAGKLATFSFPETLGIVYFHLPWDT